MSGQLRIDEVFAFVVLDDDGTEAIPQFRGPDGDPMPMLGADKARVESLRPMAKEIADRMGKPVELVRFSTRETVEKWSADKEPVVEAAEQVVKDSVPTMESLLERAKAMGGKIPAEEGPIVGRVPDDLQPVAGVAIGAIPGLPVPVVAMTMLVDADEMGPTYAMGENTMLDIFRLGTEALNLARSFLGQSPLD